MENNVIEDLLGEKIGLDADAIGRKVIQRAVRLRMDHCRSSTLEDYAKLLAASNEELKHLIEMVVVPETWFFRNRKVFNFLARFVQDRWLKENPGRTLKVLSIPCSTGEEPYSIAMALMDAGITEDRFSIEGFDISETALSKARGGVYGQVSFRGKDLAFRDRYFRPKNDCYEILTHVRDRVRFKMGNVLKNRFAGDALYDVIFCRNLMIYMSPEARTKTLCILSRLLAEEGLFFSGHAERQTAIEWGFEAVSEPGVFACRKRCRESTRKNPLLEKPKKETNNRQPHGTVPNIGIKQLKRGPSLAAVSVEKKTLFAPVNSTAKKETSVNLFQRARMMADQGQLSESLQLCEVFLGENPVHAEAHFLMGLIHEAMHDGEKAEAFFNRAIYLNPEHVEALNHMAFIELQRGNKNGAERFRQRAGRISEGMNPSAFGKNGISGIKNGK